MVVRAVVVTLLWGMIWSAEAWATTWRDLIPDKDWPRAQGEVEADVLRVYRRAVRTRGRVRKEIYRVVVGMADSGLRSYPRSALLWYLKGVAHYGLGQYDQALGALLRARALDAGHRYERDLSFRLAVVYVYQGRFDRAVSEYRRSLALETDREARAIVASNLAECFMNLGRLRLAEMYYLRSQAYLPGYPGALWGLAVAYDRDEQIAAARQTAKAALAADPRRRYLVGPDVFFVPDGEVHYYLALAAEAAGKRAEAVREWEAYLARRLDSPWRYRAVRHLFQLGVRPRGLALEGFGALVIGPATMSWTGTQGRWLLARLRPCVRGWRLGPDSEDVVRVRVSVARNGALRSMNVLARHDTRCLERRLRSAVWPTWARGRDVEASLAVRLQWSSTR